MEKKRKLPARAAARVEQVAKKRNITPRESSATPALPQSPAADEPPPPPPLPKSIQPGKPLPVVEEPQSEELPLKEFQSLQESGVLVESLARSRNKWVSEGLFEKYWTKPHKRKGVVHEDPKNPPKDSMTKVGNVTITIEPHVIEATMFAVKDPKSRAAQHAAPQQAPATRPIIQYGPPNGSMPPPPTPTPAPTTPTATLAAPQTTAPNPGQSASQPLAGSSLAQPVAPNEPPKPGSGAEIQPPAAPPLPSAVASTTSLSHKPTKEPAASPSIAPPSAAPAPVPRPPPSMSPGQPAGSTSQNTAKAPAVASAPSPGVAKPATPAGTPTTPAAKPAANDPVIALLAQKASGDPELRDLMKRVAVGQAKDGELAHFQKIIDQLNAEYKRKGGQQGPSADRLLVDGRTVKYFADEVRTILDIVLASNPNQKSSELRPPPRSDPLVVLLVKTALEDQRVRDMIRRIAEGRPGHTDSTDLKETLDRLHRDAKALPKGQIGASPMRQPVVNGIPNGQGRTGGVLQHPNPQALRSKGPPPVSRADVTAVVFDFGGGDRYLFPKYSILEYLPTTSGQQVVASFLIVRKGSTSEYGGDPKLDYYQPVTIRMSTPTGRHLENLARAVAPQDEVRRYMEDVMENMTRAEYVLLAMRLPRVSKEAEIDGGVPEEPKTNGSTPIRVAEPEHAAAPKQPVLWTAQASNTASREASQPKALDPEEETQLQYERLIKSVIAKDPEVI